MCRICLLFLVYSFNYLTLLIITFVVKIFDPLHLALVRIEKEFTIKHQYLQIKISFIHKETKGLTCRIAILDHNFSIKLGCNR